MARWLKLLLVAGILVLGLPSGAEAGVFVVHCRFSHTAQHDPIVAPGMTSSHQHEFFGNTSVDLNSTLNSMRQGGTTCNDRLDLSGYWMPSLIVDGARVAPSSINAYYRSFSHQGTVRPYPQGLKVISNRHHYHCGSNVQRTTLPSNCGNRFVHVTIMFQKCWDGESIDSSDHMSHMQHGNCDRAHPVDVPRLQMIARYPIHNAVGARLSSGSATTMHGDFWNVWDADRLQQLVNSQLN